VANQQKGDGPVLLNGFSLSFPQSATSVKSWHLLGVVLVATFLAYARTLSYEFVHDDFLQFVTNPAIHSWTYVPQYFSKNVWAEVYPGTMGNYYRPVFLLWGRLNEALFGDQPGFWHLSALLAHLAATSLVYFIFVKLTADQLGGGISAIVFGLHPVHIESVAWISGATDPLMTVFLMGSFLCYIHKARRAQGRAIWIALSLFLFALAMLTKETAVILPAILWVYEYIQDRSERDARGWLGRAASGWNALRATLPFFALVIPYLAARTWAVGGFRHLLDNSPVQAVLYTWPSLGWFFIRHLVAPFGLSMFYELRRVDDPALANFVLPILGVACAGAGIVWYAIKSRLAALATAWIILPLLPMLDLRVLPPNDFAHDRYLYLPSVGVAILVSMAIRRLPAHSTGAFNYPKSQLRVTFVLAMVLGLGTATQSFFLRNNWIFYRYSYSFAPTNPYAANDLAVILGRLGKYEDAVPLFQKAIHEDPGYWAAVYNLGYAYYQLERLDLAVQQFQRAISIDPWQPDEYRYWGLAELKLGHADVARRVIEAGIGMNPKARELHLVLGLALKVQGNFSGALQAFREELSIHPTNPEARREAETIERNP
jgi:protein O-mannosyl-transferase